MSFIHGISVMSENLMFVFAVFVAFVCALVTYYLYAPYLKVRRVPGPPPYPLVGHIPYLAKYGPDVFSSFAKLYGPIYRFHLGRQPLVIIADAELCKEAGIRKFKHLPNRSIPSPISASPLHQKGLFFTRDTRWSKMRNTIISLYQPSHLSTLLPTMQSFIESSTENFNDLEDKNGEIVFSDLCLKLATDIIGQAAFGIDFGLSKPVSTNDQPKNDEVSEFINQHIYSTTTLKMDLSGSFSIILGLLIPFLQEPVRQIFKRIPGTMDWKLERSNKKLSTRVDCIVEKREKDEKKCDSKDFLSLILSARESDEVSRNLFTSDYVSALAYEHLLAGSATTSFTLSSILYLVSGHPQVERKLIEEIDGFGPRDQVPSAHDLQHKFPYLDQVIKEAMRMYPVSPLIARETITAVEIGGYQLPKGTWVWLAPGVLAKNPKNFPEPEKFKPERFDPNGNEQQNRHPYAHIPFGIGPRACLGQKFALQEMKLSIIHLYRNYVFRHSPNMEKPLQIEYGIILNYKHGVKLQVMKRFFKELVFGAPFIDHLLHNLPFNGHPHTTSPNTSLNTNQRLHAPQRNSSLLSHLSPSYQRLQPHNPLQRLQRSARQEAAECSLDANSSPFFSDSTEILRVSSDDSSNCSVENVVSRRGIRAFRSSHLVGPLEPFPSAQVT